jgi:hypothetical protein
VRIPYYSKDELKGRWMEFCNKFQNLDDTVPKLQFEKLVFGMDVGFKTGLLKPVCPIFDCGDRLKLGMCPLSAIPWSEKFYFSGNSTLPKPYCILRGLLRSCTMNLATNSFQPL